MTANYYLDVILIAFALGLVGATYKHRAKFTRAWREIRSDNWQLAMFIVWLALCTVGGMIAALLWLK